MIKLLRTAAFNLSSKKIYLKAQFCLFVNGLVVRLGVYAPNVGCSNPHRLVSFNFTHNKFCKSSINDYFLVYALNFIMCKEFY